MRRPPIDRFVFWYFNEFVFCYVKFFYTLTLVNTEENTKLNIYTSHTHTQLHTDKKRKGTHPSTFFSICMKKLLNELRGEQIICLSDSYLLQATISAVYSTLELALSSRPPTS